MPFTALEYSCDALAVKTEPKLRETCAGSSSQHQWNRAVLMVAGMLVLVAGSFYLLLFLEHFWPTAVLAELFVEPWDELDED